MPLSTSSPSVLREGGGAVVRALAVSLAVLWQGWDWARGDIGFQMSCPASSSGCCKHRF